MASPWGFQKCDIVDALPNILIDTFETRENLLQKILEIIQFKSLIWILMFHNMHHFAQIYNAVSKKYGIIIHL